MTGGNERKREIYHVPTGTEVCGNNRKKRYIGGGAAFGKNTVAGRLGVRCGRLPKKKLVIGNPCTRPWTPPFQSYRCYIPCHNGATLPETNCTCEEDHPLDAQNGGNFWKGVRPLINAGIGRGGGEKKIHGR